MIKRLMSLTLLLLALLSPSANAALNSTVPASVTFSPQTELNGYLSELISVIDSTDEQLEIALYGFEDHDVYDALKRASERGVEIRLLLEGAKEDRKESENTLSHLLEENGIDVRYVNKIMHDKFLIADKTFLVTSSGNWNIYANSIYDENTLWISDEELVTRYRAEFEKLWQNARDFGKTFAFSQKGADPDS
jgi:phosphatidylserine/phosphatidylglycerophosphate/cardiolipin synthase-like enzyme